MNRRDFLKRTGLSGLLLSAVGAKFGRAPVAAEETRDEYWLHQVFVELRKATSLELRDSQGRVLAKSKDEIPMRIETGAHSIIIGPMFVGIASRSGRIMECFLVDDSGRELLRQDMLVGGRHVTEGIPVDISELGITFTEPM